MKIKEIKAVKPTHALEAYAHVISPLPSDEGGGFLITFPDLPGCMSDGETIEEAIHNGRDAFLAWISAWADMGKTIPPPSYRAPDTESRLRPANSFRECLKAFMPNLLLS